MNDCSPTMFHLPALRRAARAARRAYYRDLAETQVNALMQGAWWAASPLTSDDCLPVDLAGRYLSRWHDKPGANKGFAAGIVADLPWPGGDMDPGPDSYTAVTDRYTAALIRALLLGLGEAAVAADPSGRHVLREARPDPLYGAPVPVQAGVALAVGDLTTDEQVRVQGRLVGSGVEMVPSLGWALPYVCDMAGLARFPGVRVLVVIVARHFLPDTDTVDRLRALHASGLPITALYLDTRGGAEDDRVRTSTTAGAIRPVSSALVLDPRAPIPGDDIATAVLRAVGA